MLSKAIIKLAKAQDRLDLALAEEAAAKINLEKFSAVVATWREKSCGQKRKGWYRTKCKCDEQLFQKSVKFYYFCIRTDCTSNGDGSSFCWKRGFWFYKTKGKLIVTNFVKDQITSSSSMFFYELGSDKLKIMKWPRWFHNESGIVNFYYEIRRKDLYCRLIIPINLWKQ